MSRTTRIIAAAVLAVPLVAIAAGTASADPTTNCMTATVCAPVNVSGPLLGGVGTLPTLPAVPTLPVLGGLGL